MDGDANKLCVVCCRPFGLSDQGQRTDIISKLSDDIRSSFSNAGEGDVFWKSFNFVEEFNRLESSSGLSLCPVCLFDFNELRRLNENMSFLENQVIALQKQILKGLRDIEECQLMLKCHQEKIRITVDKSDVSCLHKMFPLDVNQLNRNGEDSNNFASKLRKWIIQDSDSVLSKERRLKGNLSISPNHQNREKVFVKVEHEPDFDDNDDHFDLNSNWEPSEQELLQVKIDLQESTNQKNKKPRIKYGLRKTSSMTLRTRVEIKPNQLIQPPITTISPSKKTKTSLTKPIRKKIGDKSSSKQSTSKINSVNKPIRKRRNLVKSNPVPTDSQATVKCYSCQLCNFKTRKIPSFEQHLREHENSNSKTLQKCPQCPSQFSTNQYLQFHEKLHRDYHNHTVSTPTFRCDICLKYFPILYLPDHIKSHSSLNPSQTSIPPPQLIFCQNCSFCCTTSQAYVNHLRSHYVSDTAKFPCSICSQEFNNPTNLIRHYPLVHEEFKETIHCDVDNCSKIFPCKDTMWEHKRYVHKFKAKSIPCKDTNCTKMFSSVTSMEIHYCVHSGEKPFPCELCGERYVYREGLNSHRRRVHGAAKLKCVICGKEFFQPRTLRSHMALHENRGVSCEICGMIFGSNKALKIHLGTHSEETKWTCEKCGKGFKSKDGWRDHMAAHENKKNLKCEYCGKGFVRKSNLKEHLRVHTGERPYICDVCGKDFNQASALRIHKRSQHK